MPKMNQRVFLRSNWKRLSLKQRPFVCPNSMTISYQLVSTISFDIVHLTTFDFLFYFVVLSVPIIKGETVKGKKLEIMGFRCYTGGPLCRIFNIGCEFDKANMTPMIFR